MVASTLPPSEGYIRVLQFICGGRLHMHLFCVNVTMYLFQLLKVSFLSNGWLLNLSTSEDSPLPVTSGCLVSCFFFLKLVFSATHHALPFMCLLSSSLCRSVHVGDLDVRHQAFPGGKEQRCDRQDRERRAVGHASSVPAHPLQSDDQVLVV